MSSPFVEFTNEFIMQNGLILFAVIFVPLGIMYLTRLLRQS